MVLLTHFHQTYMQPFYDQNHSLCTIDNCSEFVATDLYNLTSHLMILQFPLWTFSRGWVAWGSVGTVCQPATRALFFFLCTGFIFRPCEASWRMTVHHQGATAKVFSSKDAVKHNCNSFSVLLKLLSFYSSSSYVIRRVTSCAILIWSRIMRLKIHF